MVPQALQAEPPTRARRPPTRPQMGQQPEADPQFPTPQGGGGKALPPEASCSMQQGTGCSEVLAPAGSPRPVKGEHGYCTSCEAASWRAEAWAGARHALLPLGSRRTECPLRAVPGRTAHGGSWLRRAEERLSQAPGRPGGGAGRQEPGPGGRAEGSVACISSAPGGAEGGQGSARAGRRDTMSSKARACGHLPRVGLRPQLVAKMT